jgi:hypothetical protein
MFSHKNDGVTNFNVALRFRTKDDGHHPVFVSLDKVYASQMTAQEHEATYKSICEEIERHYHDASQNELFLSTTIMLTGKLRGEPIKMRFKDQETYYQFLKHAALIPPAQNKLTCK